MALPPGRRYTDIDERRQDPRTFVPWRDGKRYDPAGTNAATEYGYTGFTFTYALNNRGLYAIRNYTDSVLFISFDARTPFLATVDPLAVVGPYETTSLVLDEGMLLIVSMVAGYHFQTSRGTIYGVDAQGLDLLTDDPRGVTAGVVIERVESPPPNTRRGWTRQYDFWDLTQFGAQGQPGVTVGQPGVPVTVQGAVGQTVRFTTPNVAVQGCLSYNAIATIAGLAAAGAGASALLEVSGYTTRGMRFPLASGTITTDGTFTANPTTPGITAIQASVRLSFITPPGGSAAVLAINDLSCFIDFPG